MARFKLADLLDLYQKLINQYRIFTLVFLGLIFLFSLGEISNFRLDASSDTLVLEGNEELEFYQKTVKKYGSDSFVILTFTPNDKNVFSETSLRHISKLHNSLLAPDEISSVFSIYNAPLLSSPTPTFRQIDEGLVINLSNNNYSSVQDVRKELLNSPIYKDLLVSSSGELAAFLINFAAFKTDNPQAEEAQNIKILREIAANFSDKGSIFMGGVPMIVADSIDYIRSDIKIFGAAVTLLILAILYLSFKKIKWVVIPMLNSFIIVVITVGFFGFINWPVTVVSANFISLLLIISISLVIHLIVHYEELLEDSKKVNKDELIANTIKEKFKPCFYTALTTIVAFGSLVVSDIKPVISFGYMMSVGIIIALITTFLFIPTILTFVEPKKIVRSKNDIQNKLAGFICYILEFKKTHILVVSAIAIMLSIFGLSKISVENRFIDYYKEDTEIYRGMEIIDKELGGTTPVDIIIKAPNAYLKDEFSNKKDYFYNSFSIDEIRDIHDYLDSLPETGKTLSLASSLDYIKVLNDDEIDSFFLEIVRDKISPEIKKILIDPFLSEDGNEIKISVRVYETSGQLKRRELIDKIKNDISEKFYINPEDIRITGMLVLYNDMLESLFSSQIESLAAVFIMILIMFIILFRKIKFSLFALIPNVVSAIFVLGMMGLFGIPLDIMTITIAAITVGIAVDDTIHYLHRLLLEYEKNKDMWQAIKNTQYTIGRAIYLTSLTISVGFSVLILSNFVPTIYFGILTMLAMLIALLADLILLPLFLLYFQKHLK